MFERELRDMYDGVNITDINDKVLKLAVLPSNESIQ